MGQRQPFSRSRLSIKYPKPEVDYVAALVRAQEAEATAKKSLVVQTEGGRAEGSTDAAFTHKLGVSLSLWRKTRDGRKPLGWKLFLAGLDLAPYSVMIAARDSLERRAKARGNEAA